ncbi:MAG: hypothetical protein ABSG21_14930 [Spirochaetia bacterium]|jgi:hypothetical protein
MKWGRTVLFLAAGLAIFGGAAALSAQSAAGTPFLPGVAAKDPFPNGCVDCHKDQGDGKDFTVIAELAKISGHPKIDKIAKVVPKDCLICHKGGPKPPVFNQAMHRVHFQKPAENRFITEYKGACLNCHSLDLTTGEMSMKSGPKNW